MAEVGGRKIFPFWLRQLGTVKSGDCVDQATKRSALIPTVVGPNLRYYMNGYKQHVEEATFPVVRQDSALFSTLTSGFVESVPYEVHEHY